MKTQKQAEVIWKHLMRGDVLMYRLGLEDALPVTQMVAVYILAHPGTIVERIVKHPYFLKYSRSTVKRAVSLSFTLRVTSSTLKVETRELIIFTLRR